MFFKTELHCHTGDVSPCSSESAASTVKKYIKSGYSTVVLTNHLNETMFTLKLQGVTDWKKKARFFIDGFNRFRDAAGGDLYALMGAEIRFPGTYNDYLWYGFSEDDLLDGEWLMHSDIENFSRYVRKSRNMLLIQAHPFRYGMTIVDPSLLDGIEVYNGHPRHASNNPVAEKWAESYPELIKTSGTDSHDAWHVPDAGIETVTEIKTISRLFDILKSGGYDLICDEKVRVKALEDHRLR